MSIVPIRGKPRTLERTMMNSGYADGGREGRAMGTFTNFRGFYTPGLECTQTRVLGVITPPTLDQTQLLTENAFLLYIVHCTYKPNLCAFLLLSLRTKFFIPAIHLFTALGLSSGSTGRTSTEGSTGRERGVIGTELSSSVVDMSAVNAGVFWRG